MQTTSLSSWAGVDLPACLRPISDLHDAALQQQVQRLLDQKTKPVGSLGRLEALALRLACILGTPTPVLQQPQMLVCAGDHGLAARGVSAYPTEVTWQMVQNFLAGGAAVSVLARQHHVALHVLDCGVARDISAPAVVHHDGAPELPAPRLWACKVAYGTQDCSQGPAMTPVQCLQAIAHGAQVVQQLPGNAVLLGEMGIGNTSNAALLTARLCGLPLEQVTGMGTGLDAAGVQRKLAVLQQVLQRHPQAQEPLQVLATMGGFELAAMVGIVLQAAHERRVVLVDGFITTAAVLVASRLQPQVLQRCVFAHSSGEPGHALLLHNLGVQALLDWQLRLGEGSGAALAWPLLDSACRILCDMASFAEAGVATRSGDAATHP